VHVGVDGVWFHGKCQMEIVSQRGSEAGQEQDGEGVAKAPHVRSFGVGVVGCNAEVVGSN